ncbi:MAG: DUF4124 domain-containing protein [Rhodocyclaceae bacterium]|nr:DUF4124 domain-containing protein [Rhodocyclaceae bacterium]
MSPIRLCPLIAAAMLPIGAFAQVYSWKDASGKIHYGDRPPADKQLDARKVAPPPPAAEDAAAARQALAEKKLSEWEKKAEKDAQQPAEDPAQARIREENCRHAKANLAGIESGQIRFRMSPTGEREALDGAVREAELARARQAVSDWCAPAKTTKAAPGK